MAFLRGSKAWRTTWPRCCAFRAALSASKRRRSFLYLPLPHEAWNFRILGLGDERWQEEANIGRSVRTSFCQCPKAQEAGDQDFGLMASKAALLLPSPFFVFRFFVSPKSEPSRSFRPTRFLAASLLVFPLTLLPLSPLSYFFSAAPTQWVIPAHWVFRNLLSLPCFRPPPAFTLAWSQSVFPTHLATCFTPLNSLHFHLPFLFWQLPMGVQGDPLLSLPVPPVSTVFDLVHWLAIPLAPCPHTNHIEYGKE